LESGEIPLDSLVTIVLYKSTVLAGLVVEDDADGAA